MKDSAKNSSKSGYYTIALLAIVLAVLFWRSFLPDYVHFSNDGPLGQQQSNWSQMPSGISGMWQDLNFVGGNSGTYTLSVTALLHAVLSPVAIAKFYPVIAIFIMSLGAWTFFRQLKLSPFAAAMGALACMLNSTFFSAACWGVASQQIAIGMNFFAIALIIANTDETPQFIGWTRIALAGLCVGMNVMEGADIGALFSMLIAIFVLFHALSEGSGSIMKKTFHGFSRVIILAAFAGLIATQMVLALVESQVEGMATIGQDQEAKAQHWDWATQWSLPKAETVGLIVPGLFGYKMDTPKDMMPAFRESYQGGVYWGGVGRSPELDRYFDGGSQGQEPSGPNIYMRFTGGGNYCGILVLLVAGWAIAQSLRRQNSVFSDAQKRMIRFWAVVMLLCLLFAWGRFAPFYSILYQLPYFSTIRNPAKFLIFLSFASVIIFAYGVDAINRRYLDSTATKAAGLGDQLKNWWARASGFDRKWTFITAGLLGASVLGWLIYAAQKPALIAYLQKVGFPDADPTHDNSAPAIAAFSIGQVEWFLALFAIAVALLVAVISGYFNGPRAKIGAALLGSFLIFDMSRANLPWIIHWDYHQKYEVDSLNPIVKFLADKPYQHRVAGLPFRAPQGLELFDELYRIEWVQHHFPFYNIQTLDLFQMPRMPEDMREYTLALTPKGDMASAPLIAREWQLTNTRYLLGPAGFLDIMNEQLDPIQHRFKILQRFEVMPKPGIAQPTRLEELTAVPNENGNYALFEFTGALPRAKIYNSWEVNTNDTVNLRTLADLNFDPATKVLVSTPVKGLPTVATNENSGSVDYKSYASKHIVLDAQTTKPAVLLLNDKYDPHWTVAVDGKPAELLRCNFIMRGVYLPDPGQHTVTFEFSLPHKPLYITMSAIFVGIGLCCILFIHSRRNPIPKA